MRAEGRSTGRGREARAARRAALLLCLACVGCGRGGPAVGVIDVDEVLKDYRRSREVQDGLEKEKRDLEAKGQEMVDEISRLVRESEILSEEARKEREARIREKSAALEAFRLGATRNLMEKSGDEYRKIMVEVREAAAAVARRRRLDLVLDASSAAYSDRRLDLTGEVAAELNRRLVAEPAASPR
ncbi:MAG: OmpH family outer membrane protein [bacterium]|nr:OmpH family outer membrane protein [bacterium]